MKICAHIIESMKSNVMLVSPEVSFPVSDDRQTTVEIHMHEGALYHSMCQTIACVKNPLHVPQIASPCISISINIVVCMLSARGKAYLL